MTINMADFRRYRDALLEARAMTVSWRHGDQSQRDLNEDGFYKFPAPEGVYPREDFDGDGKVTADD